MTMLVLTNPNGYRVQRSLPRLQASLEQMTKVEHFISNDLTELDALLGARQWQREDLIIVNGGDGTVQHLLTRLLALCPAASLPRLAILPGGTTNMTAFAFNRSRSYRSSLNALKNALSGKQIQCQEHKLVQVSNGVDKQVGVFFGAAAVVRGIEYFHDRLNQRGARSEWGVGLVVLRAAWSMARRKAPFAESTRVHLSGSGEFNALILLVTSLERLILGIRPYWGQQPGFLHLTLIEQRAPHFLRYLARLVRGNPGHSLRPENGYHSRNINQLELTIDGPFTIDGEIFQNQGRSIQHDVAGPLHVLPL
jgi:diacylglycerol kinase (ATP)